MKTKARSAQLDSIALKNLSSKQSTDGWNWCNQSPQSLFSLVFYPAWRALLRQVRQASSFYIVKGRRPITNHRSSWRSRRCDWTLIKTGTNCSGVQIFIRYLAMKDPTTWQCFTSVVARFYETLTASITINLMHMDVTLCVGNQGAWGWLTELCLQAAGEILKKDRFLSRNG